MEKNISFSHEIQAPVQVIVGFYLLNSHYNLALKEQLNCYCLRWRIHTSSLRGSLFRFLPTV